MTAEIYRIKPLEWEQVSSKIFDARAAGMGMYRIQFKSGCWMAFKIRRHLQG